MAKIASNEYRFIDKDPVIDVIRTEMQRYGNLGHAQIMKLSIDSGVSASTIHNWLFGDVRRPQSLSTRMVLQELAVDIQYVREDGTKVRQPAPQLIPKAEQERILKLERQREKEREKAKEKEKVK